MDNPFVAGDAVHHLVVDAGADARWEAVVTHETWGSAHLPDAALRMGIEVPCGLAWLHQLHDFAQDGGDDRAGFRHDFQLTGRFDFHATSLLDAGAGGCDSGALCGGKEVSEQIHRVSAFLVSGR